MKKNINILITNDDGYLSKGIHYITYLVKEILKIDKVHVYAPSKNQSFIGTSIRKWEGFGEKDLLTEEKYEFNNIKYDINVLNATPSSCVLYGLDKISKVDLIISGINLGFVTSKIGFTSGTIGSAMTGALKGIPAISLSGSNNEVNYTEFDTILSNLFEVILNMEIKRGNLINIIIPPSENLSKNSKYKILKYSPILDNKGMSEEDEINSGNVVIECIDLNKLSNDQYNEEINNILGKKNLF